MKSLAQLSLGLFFLAVVGAFAYAVFDGEKYFDLNTTKRLWETPKIANSVVLKKPTDTPKALPMRIIAQPSPTNQPQPEPTFQKTPSMLDLEARIKAQVNYVPKTFTPEPTVKLLPTIPPYQPLPTRPPANVYWHPNPPAPTVPYGFSN